MTTLFNITHDADNLDEYDSTVTDAGDLATGTPGLADSTAKMEALIDNTTSIYGEATIDSAMTHLRVRFYIDPNTLTMTTDEDQVVVSISGAINDNLAEVVLLWDGASFEIWWIGMDDGATWKTTSKYDITDEPHYVEFHVVRASSDVAADGTVDLWIDGVSKEQITAIDNYDQMGNVGWIRMGATRAVDAGTSGTLYLDELKGNDDGGAIGPRVCYGFFGLAGTIHVWLSALASTGIQILRRRREGY